MFEAVNDFILKFAPGVVQDNIYRGYFNRASLPDVQDYTVISVSDTSRVGTNIGRRCAGCRQYLYDKGPV